MSGTSSDDCSNYHTPNKHRASVSRVARERAGIAHIERMATFIEVTGGVPSIYCIREITAADHVDLRKVDDTVDWRQFLEANR